MAPKTREQLYQESRKKVQRAGTDYPHMDTCQVGVGVWAVLNVQCAQGLRRAPEGPMMC